MQGHEFDSQYQKKILSVIEWKYLKLVTYRKGLSEVQGRGPHINCALTGGWDPGSGAVCRGGDRITSSQARGTGGQACSPTTTDLVQVSRGTPVSLPGTSQGLHPSLLLLPHLLKVPPSCQLHPLPTHRGRLCQMTDLCQDAEATSKRQQRHSQDGRWRTYLTRKKAEKEEKGNQKQRGRYQSAQRS